VSDATSDLDRLGPLVEPARRRLYEFVSRAADAVSREQAADGLGLPLHTAKFHLDKLVEAGLLEVEFRRLTGRSGPGAGRPAKLYRVSGRQLMVSVPPRRYELVGEVLAAAVDRSVAGRAAVQTAVRDAARERGRRVAADVVPAAGEQGRTAASELTRVAEALAALGYEPRRRGSDLELANCPFDALAREHTGLVCGLNVDFVAGLIDGLSCRCVEPRLEPEAGQCCVKVGARG
jgi:predicted ArsR family transcriptional regulator